MSLAYGNRRRGGNGLWIALAVILGLLLAAMVIAGTIERVVPSNQIIKVRGFAEQPITSDLARWTVVVQARDSRLARASTRLQADTKRTLDFLKENGIANKQLTVRAATTQEQYRLNRQGYSTGEIAGYLAEQRIEVESKEVAKISALASSIMSLVAQGVNLRTEEPAYYYSQVDALKMQLLKAAAEDAYARAKILAESSGSDLGAVRAARQGKFQITSAHNTEASGGYYDTSSIEKENDRRYYGGFWH